MSRVAVPWRKVKGEKGKGEKGERRERREILKGNVGAGLGGKITEEEPIEEVR